jgi:transcriptional regulator of acetoin/glycerol metabolism
MQSTAPSPVLCSSVVAALSSRTPAIFLDEIPMDTQIALLRVLQERQIERVGGSRAIPVDV